MNKALFPIVQHKNFLPRGDIESLDSSAPDDFLHCR
jgi:hypothetical protein